MQLAEQLLTMARALQLLWPWVVMVPAHQMAQLQPEMALVLQQVNPRPTMSPV